MKSGSSHPSNNGPPERDPAAIRELFGRIALRYDLANHLLSGGLDFWWRAHVAAIVRHGQPRRVLDLACGSGDLALAIARKIPEAKITAADFSAEMLAAAQAKGLTNTVLADALALPFAESSFDVVTVAFGLRNMADWGAALREMKRVLAPGGRLLILDFSLPRAPLLKIVYRFYLHRCLPLLAKFVTGEADAYRYLGASIEEFPSGAAMSALLEKNGFAPEIPKPLSGGIVTIYCATKPNESASTRRLAGL